MAMETQAREKGHGKLERYHTSLSSSVVTNEGRDGVKVEIS